MANLEIAIQMARHDIKPKNKVNILVLGFVCILHSHNMIGKLSELQLSVTCLVSVPDPKPTPARIAFSITQ